MAEAMESFSLPRPSRQPLGRHWRAPNTGITILIFLSALNAARVGMRRSIIGSKGEGA
jgi:hypothetical protein